MLYSIGADPEFFIRQGDKHIAICGKLGGTKDNPKQLGDGFAVQEDNVAVEYNIPPCTGRNEFIHAIGSMQRRLGLMFEEKGHMISRLSSVSFDLSELTHPSALVFGCEPDYNAWTRTENEFPEVEDKTLRTAGGHIHVGTDVNMIDGVGLMDLHLGVPSIIIDNNPASQRRRELYGKAGAMRPKEYGFEYRTLSNFWIFDPILVGWVYDATHAAVSSGKVIGVRLANKIQKAINESNVELAKEICISNNIYVPQQ